MSTDMPSDPFLPFARSLLHALLARRQGEWIDFNSDDTEAIEEYSAIIAQRVADLVATHADTVELFAYKILMMIGTVYGEIVRVSDRKAIDLQTDLIDAIEQLCKERTMKGISHDTTGATLSADQPQPLD